jgi:hypothetical protein
LVFGGNACLGSGNQWAWLNSTNTGPCLGNPGRNAFTGPAFATMDFAVQKSFPMGEARSLVFRTEFYSLFNRANYYNPISTLSNDGTDQSGSERRGKRRRWRFPPREGPRIRPQPRRKADIENAVSTPCGFGGTNSSRLIFCRW